MIIEYKPAGERLPGVAGAAVRVDNNVYHLPVPHNHADIISKLGINESTATLGFLSIEGHYYPLKLAAAAAVLNNQLTPEYAYSLLYERA